MAEYRKVSGFTYSVCSLSAHLIGLNKKCKGLIFEYYPAKE